MKTLNTFITSAFILLGFTNFTAYCSQQDLDKDSVDTSRRYDQSVFVTSHNAFANVADGWRFCWGPHHQQNLSQQLEAGVSAFMLDIWPYKPKNKDLDIYHWHGDPNAFYSWFAGGPKSMKTMLESMNDVVSCLKKSPDRVLTIFFEDHVQKPTALVGILEESGAEAYAFHPHKTIHKTYKGDIRWNVAKQGWPTLKWLCDNNLRLIMFTSDLKSAETLAFTHHYVLENIYGYKSITPSTFSKLRKESIENEDTAFKKTNGHPLMLMNHFPTWPFNFGTLGKVIAHCLYSLGTWGRSLSYYFYPAELDHVKAELLQRIKAIKKEEYCKKMKKFRAPNFIGLNYLLGTEESIDRTLLDLEDELVHNE